MEDLILLLEMSSLRVHAGGIDKTAAGTPADWTCVSTRLTGFQQSDRRWHTMRQNYMRRTATSPLDLQVRRKRVHVGDP